MDSVHLSFSSPKAEVLSPGRMLKFICSKERSVSTNCRLACESPRHARHRKANLLAPSSLLGGAPEKPPAGPSAGHGRVASLSPLRFTLPTESGAWTAVLFLCVLLQVVFVARLLRLENRDH